MTAIELLRRLTEVEPYVADQLGNRDCGYCREGISTGDHAPDCPWVAAKAWVEEQDCMPPIAPWVQLEIQPLSNAQRLAELGPRAI